MHVRGKVIVDLVLTKGHGITPAYAGKSSRNETCWHRPWDHPCVCGEKVPITCVPKYALGSPPRVRGKAEPERLRQLSGGITPACAGKSAGGHRTGGMAGDHPRVCGEKSLSTRASIRRLGSPPRVRGKDRSERNQRLCGGITPACAGKSGSCPASPPWSYPPRITVSRPRP